MPKGYVAVNTDSAKWDEEGGPQYNNGLVISDAQENGNEWVWIPVENATVMYESADPPIEITGGADLEIISGVATDKYSKSEIITGIARVTPNTGRNGYREPDIVDGDGTTYDAVKENYTVAGFTSLANMAQTMVSEYSDMINSIEKYGGFYIGRYELTADGVKPGETLVKLNWYHLYANCKMLAKENSNTTSRMIWGCQWDVTCNWLAENGYDITDSSGWGNHANSTGSAAISGYGTIQNTGYSEYWKANNIYDLAGNCSEYTQEAYNKSCRIMASGSATISTESRNVTTKRTANPSWTNISTRATLTLKP